MLRVCLTQTCSSAGCMIAVSRSRLAYYRRIVSFPSVHKNEFDEMPCHNCGLLRWGCVSREQTSHSEHGFSVDSSLVNCAKFVHEKPNPTVTVHIALRSLSNVRMDPDRITSIFRWVGCPVGDVVRENTISGCFDMANSPAQVEV